MKSIRLIIFNFFIICLMVTTWTAPVSAASASEISTQIAQTNSEIDNLGKQIESLNSQIASLDANIASNEQNLSQKQTELMTEKEGMGARARAIYMYGNESYLNFLFASENIGDFLSKLEKVSSILQADQSQIQSIQETQSSIEASNTQLETDRESLSKNKSEIETAQNEQQSKLAEEQKQLKEYQTAAQAEGITPSGAGLNMSSGNATAATDNMDFICAVVAQEGGTSYEGALAVISCIMNRVDSGAWGGSDAISVITAPWQFAAYDGGNGPYQKYLGQSLPEVQQAVIDCMQGGIRSHSYQSFRSSDSQHPAGAVQIPSGTGNWFF